MSKQATQNGKNGTAETPASQAAMKRADRTSMVAELESALGAETETEAEAEGAEDEPEAIEVADPAGRRGASGERAQRSGGDRGTEQHEETELEESESESEGEAETEAESDDDPEAVEMPETEADAEAAAEADDEADAEAEAAGETELSAEEQELQQLEKLADQNGWPRSARRRLNRLLKQNHALRAQLANGGGGEGEGSAGTADATDADATGADATADAAGGDDAAAVPLVGVEAQLQEQIQNTEAWIERLEQALDPTAENYDAGRLTVPDEKTGKERVYTAEQVRQARRQFNRQLREQESELVAVRGELKRRQASFAAQAAQRHAFMRDPKSVERQQIASVLKAIPELNRVPDITLVLADAIAYRRLNANAHAKTKANGNGNGNGERKAAPAKVKVAGRVPARPGATPMKLNTRRVDHARRTENFGKTGSFEEGKAVLESIL
jgi:hypothetical protein